MRLPPTEYFETAYPDESPCVIRFKNHRIDLLHVVSLYQRGMQAEMIAAYFPGLELDAIHAAIAYYQACAEDVEVYMSAASRAAEERRKAPPLHPAQARLEQLLRRI